ncbi:hypothetical protein O4J56_09740 [Nocardiopsis sp. RSe5-2]|uniref:Tetratricopeptide repeat protein n=1 Tax=Nocardiopsis endophytica TaxID=3018445 RepID=A0ABT4U1V3_9ACTN|nr:hypothetical protein [Nocardiopsis endophytica]MDA2810916.1 hypothetical protein [Nocardiopsis endophytica]
MTRTLHAPRGPLPRYERDPATPLRAVRAGDRFAGDAKHRRAVWAYYLGDLSPSPQTVPMATRWLAVVEDMAAGVTPVQRLVPGSFYPAGFREQVAAGCGLADAPSAAADGGDGDAPGGLTGALDRASEAATDELVLAATSLNLQSRYRTVVRRLGATARERRDRLLYIEVLRAAYSASRSSEEAAAHFAKVADSGAWPPLFRLGAAVRLIAHYSRSTKDAESRTRWVDFGERVLRESGEDTFEWNLYRSHLDRAVALHDWMRGERDAAHDRLDTARRIAAELQAVAATPAWHLAALHAERLVLEAALKAFLYGRTVERAAEAEETADRIAAIDPADPYANLVAGDTFWALGDDGRAVRCFTRAAAAGTLAGAYAAHRAAGALEELGRGGEAGAWRQRARELDPEAP